MDSWRVSVGLSSGSFGIFQRIVVFLEGGGRGGGGGEMKEMFWGWEMLPRIL